METEGYPNEEREYRTLTKTDTHREKSEAVRL